MQIACNINNFFTLQEYLKCQANVAKKLINIITNDDNNNNNLFRVQSSHWEDERAFLNHKLMVRMTVLSTKVIAKAPPKLIPTHFKRKRKTEAILNGGSTHTLQHLYIGRWWVSRQ